MYSKGYASVPQITFVGKRQIRDQNHIKNSSFSNTQAQTGMASRFSSSDPASPAGEGSGVEPEIAVPISVFPLSPEVTGRRIRPRQVLMRLFFLVFSPRRFLSHLSSRAKRETASVADTRWTLTSSGVVSASPEAAIRSFATRCSTCWPQRSRASRCSSRYSCRL